MPLAACAALFSDNISAALSFACIRCCIACTSLLLLSALAALRSCLL